LPYDRHQFLDTSLPVEHATLIIQRDVFDDVSLKFRFVSLESPSGPCLNPVENVAKIIERTQSDNTRGPGGNLNCIYRKVILNLPTRRHPAISPNCLDFGLDVFLRRIDGCARVRPVPVYDDGRIHVDTQDGHTLGIPAPLAGVHPKAPGCE
jgi:hypothetical protein